MLLMSQSLTLALTAHAKTNVSLGLSVQVSVCGEFIILDFENLLLLAQWYRGDSGKGLVPRQC